MKRKWYEGRIKSVLIKGLVLTYTLKEIFPFKNSPRQFAIKVKWKRTFWSKPFEKKKRKRERERKREALLTHLILNRKWWTHTILRVVKLKYSSATVKLIFQKRKLYASLDVSLWWNFSLKQLPGLIRAYVVSVGRKLTGILNNKEWDIWLHDSSCVRWKRIVGSA